MRLNSYNFENCEMFSFITFVKVFEKLFFIALTLATIPFTWQAFVQYQSKDTSFKRREVPIDGSEVPALSFCFHPPDEYNSSEVNLPFHDYVFGEKFQPELLYQWFLAKNYIKRE